MNSVPAGNFDALLRRFQRRLRKNDVKSHVHISAGNSARNHIKIESVSIKIALTVTVAPDGQLEITTADRNRRILAMPDAAIGIITALAQKEPA